MARLDRAISRSEMNSDVLAQADGPVEPHVH
jgi:hypothetical protein